MDPESILKHFETYGLPALTLGPNGWKWLFKHHALIKGDSEMDGYAVRTLTSVVFLNSDNYKVGQFYRLLPVGFKNLDPNCMSIHGCAQFKRPLIAQDELLYFESTVNPKNGVFSCARAPERALHTLASIYGVVDFGTGVISMQFSHLPTKVNFTANFSTVEEASLS